MPAIDQLIRTRRKTIALIVQPDGRLIVRAPLRAASADIQAALQQHAAWITKQQTRARQKLALHPPHTYQDGEEFWYLGAPCRLELHAGIRPALTLDGAIFRLSHTARAKAPALFRAWYRARAAEFIPERVAALAAPHAFHPRGLRITSARTRWGSCSPSGRLAFTWRLMIAPPDVIDYVILHELVHLEIRNHSPAFWNRLAALVPAYKQHIRWLKTFGPLVLDL